MVPPTINLATFLSSSESANGNVHWGFVHLWAQLVAKAPSACAQIRRFCSLNVTDTVEINNKLWSFFFQGIYFFASINGTHLPGTKGCIKEDYTLHTYSDKSFSLTKNRHLNMLPTFPTRPSLREN